jgi:hypothetical protein
MQATIRRTVTLTLSLALFTGTVACSGDNPAGATASPTEARCDGGVTFGSGGRATAIGGRTQLPPIQDRPHAGPYFWFGGLNTLVKLRDSTAGEKIPRARGQCTGTKHPREQVRD